MRVPDRYAFLFRGMLVAAVLLQGSVAMAQHHFSECASGTGDSAVIIIEASSPARAGGAPMQPGDEVAVFDAEGMCAGHLVWQEGENQAITVWGENPFSEETAGLTGGEEMAFRIWSATRELEIGGGLGTVDVGYDSCESRPPICSPTGVYHSNALYYLDWLEAEFPTTGSLAPTYESPGLSAYPNPFVDRATVEVVIPQAGYVRIDLVDMLGRAAMELYEGWMDAGHAYHVSVEAGSLLPGTYIIHVQGQRFTEMLVVSYAG